MMIVDKIRQIAHQFEYVTGRRPVSVYLGDLEINQFVHAVLAGDGLPHWKTLGCDGMRIYRVCAATHLACA